MPHHCLPVITRRCDTPFVPTTFVNAAFCLTHVLRHAAPPYTDAFTRHHYYLLTVQRVTAVGLPAAAVVFVADY